MTHDDIAEVAFEVIRTAYEHGIADPLRLAHAVAVGVRLAEVERLQAFAARWDREGGRWTYVEFVHEAFGGVA